MFLVVLILLVSNRYYDVLVGMAYTNLSQVFVSKWYVRPAFSQKGYLDQAISALESASQWQMLARPKRFMLQRLKAAQELVSHTADIDSVETDVIVSGSPKAIHFCKSYPRYRLDPSTQVETPNVLTATSHGWQLLGYDLPEALFLGLWDETVVVLYWEHEGAALSPGEARVGDWHLVWAGNRACQIGRVKNLAPNGGFERTLDLLDTRPVGWPTQQYVPNRTGERALLLDQRNGVPTVVAFKDNSYREASAWYSEMIPVQEDAIYLYAGWVRTEGPSGFRLGVGWHDLERKDFYNYLAWGQTTTWTHYADLVRPLPGATAARLWLVALGEGGRVYFDDILFIRLDMTPLRQVPLN